MSDEIDDVSSLLDDDEAEICDPETEIIHRNAECPEMVRFEEKRLATMTNEELRGHIRMLYLRQDQFMDHFGRLHRNAWAARGYNPSARAPKSP